MRKKFLSILIAMTLIVSLVQPFQTQHAEAAGTYFIFDGLGASANSPMKTNDREINLTGNYSAVSESTITYTVEQILNKDTTPMRVGLRSGSSTAGLAAANGIIAVTGLDLFPGLNRITFTGMAGFSQLSDTFYVEYIDNPVIYDLELLGNLGEFPVVDNKVVVTSDMTIQPTSGNITLQGSAPNANEVMVYVNETFSRSFAVVNDRFIASGLPLVKGKNTVKLVVRNEDQAVETTKEMIYFNGDVTFFDVEFGADTSNPPDDKLGPNETYDPRQNPLVTGSRGDKLLVSGKLVVPNHYALKPEAPKIESAVVVDDGTPGWGVGDTLTITFDRDTNRAPGVNVGIDVGLNQLIDWDGLNLGQNYSGEWVDARTLVIRPDNVAGSNFDVDYLASGHRIAILPTANLRTADELSDPSEAEAQLTGTLDTSSDIPYVLSVIAVDGSNSPGLAANDEIVVTFSADTNMLGRTAGQSVDRATLLNAFSFSGSPGSDFYGIWEDARTLRIIIANATGNAFGPGGELRLLPNGVRNSADTDDAAYTYTGAGGNYYWVRGTYGEAPSSNYQPHPNPVGFTSDDAIIVELIGEGSGESIIPHGALAYSPDFYTAPPARNAGYFVIEFNDVPIGTIDAAPTQTEDLHAGIFVFDQLYTMTFQVRNYVKSAANGREMMDSQGGYSFTLRDESLSFIQKIRYLTNFDSVSAYSALTGTELNGSVHEVFESPFELELVANNNVSGRTINISAYDSNGVLIPGEVKFVDITSTRISGIPDNNRIIQITQLPRAGYQMLHIHFSDADGGNKGPVHYQPITYIFGPYASFNMLYNGMVVESPDDTTTPEIGIESLDFGGRLHNVDLSTIIDSDEVSATTPQTIFMTINGVAMDILDDDHLATDGNPATNPRGDFTVDNAAARAMLNPGRNTVVFTYQYLTEFYTRTIIINVFPTDYPEVPASGSNGIYPTTLSNGQKDPERFTELSTGMFSTEEKSFTVAGSFRLLEMDNVATELPGIPTEKYRFEIMRNGETIIKWDLGYNHFETENGTDYNNQPERRIPNFSVVYDRSTDYFTFRLNNQTVAENTGTVVYTFVAYKDTANTYYRMEIQTLDTPYTLLRPFLPEQRIVNQNYLDVVIHSEGAESITAGKFVGEKIDFDEDNNGTIDFPNAFKIRVKDLRPNRENNIAFTITLGTGETINGSFQVYYAPTNIQGAQHLQAMGNRVRAFNNAVELTFPRGTVLTNKVDPTNRNAIQKLYANHDVLMGIANGSNGVVDRRIYEDQPSGFANQIALSEMEFTATLPSRFMMASPLYWIDAGLADNPGTTAYDPVETGILPFQFRNSGLPSYMERTEGQVLVPTQRGELTLAFDPNVVQSAGIQISVFRYDPILKMWENIGGEVDTRKNTVTVPFDQFGYYTVMKLQYSFTDIMRHQYAKDEMEAIYAKGIMASFDDEAFGANSNVSRGEFAAMVVRALQIPFNYDNRNLHFDDVATVIVPGSLWDYRYIETAAREGILLGISVRRFEPYTQLTREQAAVILARALELKMEVNRAKVDQDLAKQFQDYSSIEPYARPAVLAVLKAGLMQGSPVNPTDPNSGLVFEPKDNLLRSDAAIMMSRVMASVGLLPKMN